MFKPDLEKAEELEIKFPTSIGCSYILRSGPLAVLDDFFFFSYLFLATHYGTQDLSSPTRNEPVPLQWKHRVLITALSGKSTNRIKSYDLIWVYVVHRVSGCLPIKIPGIEVGTSALAYKDFSQ